MLFKDILIANLDEIMSDSFDYASYRIGYFSFRAKNKTTRNEDVVFIGSEKDSLLFGVADGAGGHPKGLEAASLVGTESLTKKKIICDHRLNPMQAIEEINQSVVALKVGAKTTMALVSLVNNEFRAYSVGDSEILYWNAAGNLLFTNIPDSSVGYKVEAGVLAQQESLDDPTRYEVTNMMGDERISIEVSSAIEVKKGHSILVGTDGLFDNISHEDLGEILAQGKFDDAFTALCELCYVQKEGVWKKQDDIGFVFLRKIKHT